MCEHGRSHACCVQRQVPCLRSAVAAHQQGRLHPCRGAESIPHGLADHSDSPVAVHMVDVPAALVERVPLVPSWMRPPSSACSPLHAA